MLTVCWSMIISLGHLSLFLIIIIIMLILNSKYQGMSSGLGYHFWSVYQRLLGAALPLLSFVCLYLCSTKLILPERKRAKKKLILSLFKKKLVFWIDKTDIGKEEDAAKFSSKDGMWRVESLIKHQTKVNAEPVIGVIALLIWCFTAS